MSLFNDAGSDILGHVESLIQSAHIKIFKLLNGGAVSLRRDQPLLLQSYGKKASKHIRKINNTYLIKFR